MSVKTRSRKVLEQAKDLSCKVQTWADFANRMFDQQTGIVAKEFPEDVERQAFYDTEEYEQINSILADLMRKYGVVKGSNPKEKSGRFVVRVPRSVHQKLEIEAKHEGISLNQLAVSKLSLPLQDSVGVNDDLLINAFNKVHDGYSTDFVIIHPDLNAAFLETCGVFGLGRNSRALNHRLMNIRKTKKLSVKLNKATKRAGITGYDQFEYASEIAVRTLQRTQGASLDAILCDVSLRQEFDDIAQKLATHADVLHLRAGALNLRKGHRLQPIDREVEQYDLVSVGPVRQVDLSKIEALPGLYSFYDLNRPVFAGETSNLKLRIDRHLHGGIPGWAWDEESFQLRMLVMPSGKQKQRRDWLMNFVNRERPLLNYQKSA